MPKEAKLTTGDNLQVPCLHFNFEREKTQQTQRVGLIDNPVLIAILGSDIFAQF